MKLWDPRSEQACTATLATKDKVFAMDTTENMLVVASAGRMIEIYDLRQLGEPWQRRDSSLKHMTREVFLNLTFR